MTCTCFVGMTDTEVQTLIKTNALWPRKSACPVHKTAYYKVVSVIAIMDDDWDASCDETFGIIAGMTQAEKHSSQIEELSVSSYERIETADEFRQAVKDGILTEEGGI